MFIRNYVNVYKRFHQLFKKEEIYLLVIIFTFFKRKLIWQLLTIEKEI